MLFTRQRTGQGLNDLKHLTFWDRLALRVLVWVFDILDKKKKATETDEQEAD